MKRVGLRPRAPRELTETEELVARLAAEGLTNREVAKRAFISPRTVESVLARVYAKFAINSRAELGSAMGARRPPD
jgi:DNA-binding CsgD family transcriptional regulator